MHPIRFGLWSQIHGILAKTPVFWRLCMSTWLADASRMLCK